jgi:hypothetical protein
MPKISVSTKLEDDIVRWLESLNGKKNTLINKYLRIAMEKDKKQSSGAVKKPKEQPDTKPQTLPIKSKKEYK